MKPICPDELTGSGSAGGSLGVLCFPYRAHHDPEIGGGIDE